MKLSVSIPDYLWEAALVAVSEKLRLEISAAGTEKLVPVGPHRPSQLVGSALTLLVERGWRDNEPLMRRWLDDKIRRQSGAVGRAVRAPGAAPLPAGGRVKVRRAK